MPNPMFHQAVYVAWRALSGFLSDFNFETCNNPRWSTVSLRNSALGSMEAPTDIVICRITRATEIVRLHDLPVAITVRKKLTEKEREKVAR